MPASRQGGGVGRILDPGDAGDPHAEAPVPAAGGSSAASPDPLIGRTINGRFKVVSVIARGGMGKVYKAEQAPLGRVCALKVLSPKYEGDRDPEFHKRFFLEAATAAKLTHANTVTIFDYGKADDDEIYYIAMEFIEGRTLHRVLREEGPFNEERARHIAAQICRSLREAHGMGVVHRDLKPGNIMLSDKGDERDNVKVLDFGLVKDVSGEAEDLTQAGLFMGSPKYMAPEQILGGEISPATDIYSLGVMTYEMLTGKVPFDRGASVGTLMAHVNDPVPNMRQVRPDIGLSPMMESIVKRCLEKDPTKRFPSMKELLAALKRAGGEDIRETSDALPQVVLGRISMNGLPPSSSPPSHSAMAAMARRQSETEIDARAQNDSTVPGPAPPLDTDSLFASHRQQPRKKTYVWAIVVGALAAIGVAAAVSNNHGGASPTPDASASPTTTAATLPTNAPTTTATAQVTASAAPTDSAPSGPRTVHVESDPSGATVSESGTELCPATPCDVMFKSDGAEHKLTISKKGFKKQVVPAAGEKVSVKLDGGPGAVVPGPLRPKPDPYKPDPYKPDPYK